MPLVSVIIPTYNRKLRLAGAVASVIAQSFSDWELLVIDDASEDDTQSMREFSGKYPNIVYRRFDVRRGVSAARNYGVSLSRGAWICFLDSDDMWHADKLEKQVQWHGRNPEFRISQTQEIWVRDGVRVNPPKTHSKVHGFQFIENLYRCMITPSSVMMEQSLFEEVGGFNESLPACEDYDLWLRITCRYPVGLLDEYLMTRFGGHSDQLSASIVGLDRFRIRSILDVLKNCDLSNAQREAARRVLAQKADIVANGFRKRGNELEYEHYAAVARSHA